MALRRLNTVPRPAGAARFRSYQCFRSNWKSPPFTFGAQEHGERHCLKSPRRRDRHSDPHPRLVCTAARKHREGAWRKHKGLGRELIEGALPYLHGAETRYELDEMGLRCSIALPLGMDGRQERL